MSNSIYIITNTVTDKVYIGQTIDFPRRKRQYKNNHKTLDQHIYRAMRKYGFNNFTITPICSVLSQDDLDVLEIQLIDEHNSYTNGYNMTKGGGKMYGDDNPMYDKKHSIESKLKMSSKKLGIKHPRFKGYYHTPFGIFTSSKRLNNNIAQYSMYNWCNNPDKLINKKSISHSKYLTENMLGKTFRDIGFWFEPISPSAVCF